MEERYEQVRRFLGICGELADGKYNEAGAKISLLLASIARSRELTGLFTAVTRGFDYPKACETYLRFPASHGAAHGAAFLPGDRGDMLAFVFCLLVELDSGSRKLDDFLLRYFYVDGSYTASYARFADRVIRPFGEIVRVCYREILPPAVNGDADVARLIAQERVRLAPFDLPAEEREAAEILLGELSSAAERGDGTAVRALLVGYKYFLRSFNGESGETVPLFSLADDR